ncbi:MAG: aminomethyl-transferring glycine dehydrogenase [Gammaproteobacteria bacterium]|nr:aminomethyl-transferring glycine dehydrogenase [Gammaproteobacteria bacterium]
MTQPPLHVLEQHDAFIRRHIGPDQVQTQNMLQALGVASLDDLIAKTVPASIRKNDELDLASAVDEQQALMELKALGSRNKVFRSFIGMGYHDTITPNVIVRNVLENPGWYTAYTPYQPEIAQGRLEGLLNFQQMIMDLTGMELANASMLDEGTAAAEAMAMCKRQVKRNKSNVFFVDASCHPQTLAVVKTRAEHFGFELQIGDAEKDLPSELFGALLQYPGSTGEVRHLSDLIAKVHAANGLVTVAADLMSLVALKAPGEMGADAVVGCNQRFGIPLGFGGPHAGFFAFREQFKRSAPGRIIGVSVDSKGKRALRMAMQTREQHIRREKANSNICTSQVLLAVMSAFYAVYHGPEGLGQIAARIARLTQILATGLQKSAFKLKHSSWFDTLTIIVGDSQNEIYQRALAAGINLRKVGEDALGISLNETTKLQDVSELFDIFIGGAHKLDLEAIDDSIRATNSSGIPAELRRESKFLTHPVFNCHHSETEMLRYLKRLEAKDIALNHSMIPLGSCTMKLNASAEMIPVTWPEFGRIHPFAPAEQTAGYRQMFQQLEHMLAACTGYDAVSLQPNSGAQGEYAGLIAIKKYLQAKGEAERDICLIPASAHGTNPASAIMAGMKVVVVACDSNGNVDTTDLSDKIAEHKGRIAALMATYPSTHGVFEENIREICDLVHNDGGQVYIDGANLNALIGLAAPGQFGGDVSHLNLHKTFCIPHGGGGPGMGPIAVRAHLQPYLAGHPVTEISQTDEVNGTVSAAPWGSASILPISWMYIRMMGRQGMKRATAMAILNANYVAKKLSTYYPLLYTGSNGFVAHECLIDLRPLKEASGVTEEDIAKRLMDFGFHAPTMSFPVAGTLMIEPTESETQQELDRFIEAMAIIRQEIEAVASGKYSAEDNPLRNAPHTQDDVMCADWQHNYSREIAARPAPWLKSHKVWPTVNRIDNVYGDRKLICACPPIESYMES